MITAKCIKNVNPWGDYPTDLTVGEEYEVESINMGSSHTSVQLKGKHYLYNSVCFEFYENGKPLDIYEDRRFNSYIR